MFISLSLLLRGSILVLSSLALIQPAISRPACKIVSVPVTVSFPAASLPLSLELNYLSILTAPVLELVKKKVEGTFNIVGRFCEPENRVDSRKNTLQLLVHPATYDKNWWSGSGAPGYGWDGDRYDYISWASNNGYATFAFDRLGHGESDKPDPISVVQCPLQADILHQLIGKARTGPTAASNAFPRPFSNIIVGGASLGSIIINELTAIYPNDADAVILGAFTKSWVLAVPGFILRAGLRPATLVEPQYSGQHVSYLMASSAEGTAFELFYGPGQYYDVDYINYDYRTRGTITVGEGVTGAVEILTARHYKGHVLVVTGQFDVPFCSPLGLSTGNCGNGRTSILEQTKVLYPSAKSYTWHSVPNAGHCWMHQYGAKDGFKVMTNWLESKGF